MINQKSLHLLTDIEKLIPIASEHHKALFDHFADQVDNSIQNALIAEMMVRYAELSKQLEQSNLALLRYNVDLEELVREKVSEISSSQIATIHALVKSTEARDDDTGAHIERTSQYCGIIAEKLWKEGLYKDVLNEDYQENIEKASPLHDIGKTGIRDSILLKPDRLTREEFEIMKTHVVIGYETLASVEAFYPNNTFLRFGIDISRYHHEKWDGSGYMDGLAGEAIPLAARIMALADVYDALRSKRVYKDSFSHEKAVAIITEERGKHFDPILADIFIERHLLFKDVFDRLTGENG